MRLLAFCLGVASLICPVAANDVGVRTAFIVPVRQDIMPPLTYLVRRGVKEAMEAGADVLVLDMDTNGGRLDVTEEIIEIIGKFSGETVTYVNRKAFSAGAFISVATERIYMAPQSVIGAAAPVMVGPGGSAQDAPGTMELKMNSAVRALIRAAAERNGHNTDVVEAMIDPTRELVVDGETLADKEEILTLTDLEAARSYGDPPRPLLSAGTVESLDVLLDRLEIPAAGRRYVAMTGAERVGRWLTAISPLLLTIGLIGIYLEFKTPGFGVPGIVGLVAFLLYFAAGYIAGLSGMEWLVIFLLGIGLLVVEFFVMPGLLVPGLLGAFCVLAALVMAMADVYPGGPVLPDWGVLSGPIRNVALGLTGSAVVMLGLLYFLPKSGWFPSLVSTGVSGQETADALKAASESMRGREGVAVSPLRPGGRALIGDRMVDVVTRGEMVAAGTAVRVVDHSGAQPVVEAV